MRQASQCLGRVIRSKRASTGTGTETESPSVSEDAPSVERERVNTLERKTLQLGFVVVFDGFRVRTPFD